MARKWNDAERSSHKSLLYKLYIEENKTIKEIGLFLGLSEKTIYKRLKNLNIKTIRSEKNKYCNKRNDLVIPAERSADLAEFFGIMLGDGRLSPTQIVVTLGDKEKDYVLYVKNKIQSIFSALTKVSVRKEGYHDVYLGSVDLVRWLKKEGLVHNKVKFQVGVPKWIFKQKIFMESFLRGFFDTDGSVYKLRYGIQMSFCNRSLPILKSLQFMLKKLKYNPSSISLYNMYLTRREDVDRFFKEIRPSNSKHVGRYFKIKNEICADDGVVNHDTL